MSKRPKTPLCECCDEVMEDLLTMRQTFEKMFHKLSNEIIELRREVTDAMSNTTQEETASAERSSSPVTPEPPRKLKRFNKDESETNKNSKSSKNVPDKTESEPNKPSRVTQMIRMERPLLKLHNIQARVLPTQPFETAKQFEEWQAIIKKDKELCDKLKVELLQEYLIEPDKYVRNLWGSILKPEAADKYSYSAKGFSKTRPIRNYFITSVFKECFLQRFRGLDEDFFIERTMRFFKLVHSQVRIFRKKQETRDESRVQNEALTDDEVERHEYDEDSIF